ncbi:MAG: winged helix-turn-helix transcriptional regulator [Clostridia bacterium]|nr:winged helix-turn-helix transcriptional regulator [Clostridia bacterium]
MYNECLAVDEKTQSDILNYLPSQEVLELLAGYFQAYSDPTRIKILSALSMSELCVNDISTLLNINQTTVSHQLKLLKNLNVVKYKRDGKVIYYSLANQNVNDIMLNGVNHVLKV